MHFYGHPENEKKLAKMVGRNPLTKDLKRATDEHQRNESFEAVDRFVGVAREMYVGGEMEFDEMIKNLTAVLNKLKGKEMELAEIDEEPGETEESEGEEEKEKEETEKRGGEMKEAEKEE